VRQKTETKLTMVYWRGQKFWVGKLLEHPEIVTQGRTLEELEENMKDAYVLMTMEDVPHEHLARHILKELAYQLVPAAGKHPPVIRNVRQDRMI